jgi:hypothetical protein
VPKVIEDEFPTTPVPAPLNPKLLKLYELAYYKRDLIKRCVDVSRLELHRTCKQGAKGQLDNTWHSCGCEIGHGECRLLYKFTFLLSKALALANSVKGLGSPF